MKQPSRVSTQTKDDLNYRDPDMTLKERFDEFDRKLGATIGVGLISVVEGIGLAGESVVDFFVGTFASLNSGKMSDSSILNGKVLKKDSDGNYYLAFPTEEELKNDKIKLENDTMNFVKKEHVKDKFDEYFFHIDAKNNSYAFDTTRSIGNTSGKLLTYSAVSSYTSIPIWAVAAMGASGESKEKNWNDGLSFNDGTTASTIDMVLTDRKSVV